MKEAQRTVYETLAGRTVVERYRLIRLVATGGMGAVFEAEDLRQGRRLAIKTIAMFEARDALRFRREAQIAQSLSHPHITPVLDFGEMEGGFLFQVMPFLEGHTLSELIRREGILSLARSMKLLRQMSSALDYAHQRGVVHRDIKPSNVIVLPGDDLRLIDFGIAKLLTDEAGMTLTRTGAMIGTPNYMSPEQILGKPVDARTDIYSLACVAYVMLVGRSPFHELSFSELMTAHVGMAAPSLGEFMTPLQRSEIPQAVDTILLWALSKIAEARPSTVDLFYEELQAAASGAGPSSLSGELRRQASRSSGEIQVLVRPTTGERSMGSVLDAIDDLPSLSTGPQALAPTTAPMEALTSEPRVEMREETALRASSTSTATLVRAASVVGLCALAAIVAVAWWGRHELDQSPEMAPKALPRVWEGAVDTPGLVYISLEADLASLRRYRRLEEIPDSLRAATIIVPPDHRVSWLGEEVLLADLRGAEVGASLRAELVPRGAAQARAALVYQAVEQAEYHDARARVLCAKLAKRARGDGDRLKPERSRAKPGPRRRLNIDRVDEAPPQKGLPSMMPKIKVRRGSSK